MVGDRFPVYLKQLVRIVSLRILKSYNLVGLLLMAMFSIGLFAV